MVYRLKVRSKVLMQRRLRRLADEARSRKLTHQEKHELVRLSKILGQR
jgi:hypothetical protein